MAKYENFTSISQREPLKTKKWYPTEYVWHLNTQPKRGSKGRHIPTDSAHPTKGSTSLRTLHTQPRAAHPYWLCTPNQKGGLKGGTSLLTPHTQPRAAHPTKKGRGSKGRHIPTDSAHPTKKGVQRAAHPYWLCYAPPPPPGKIADI